MTIYCTRCGEELNAPKFHNGKPYGYSCYEMVSGKKSKDKRQFVVASVVGEIPDYNHFSLTLEYKGRKYQIGGVLRDCKGELHNPLVEFGPDGSVFMVTHDRKGNPVWKSIK